MRTVQTYPLILMLPAFLLGCGQGEVQSLKQTVEKQQAELRQIQAALVALKAENAELKKPKGISGKQETLEKTPASSGMARKVSIKTITGKTIDNGSLDYLTTAGRFDTDPKRKDVVPLWVSGASIELKADKVRKIEVTSLIPNPPKTYGWEAAAVTVTTTENQTFSGKCSAESWQVYFHVILPESFTMSSLEGLFKSSLTERPVGPGELERPLARGEFREIDGKKILAIPVAQISSITLN